MELGRKGGNTQRVLPPAPGTPTMFDTSFRQNEMSRQMEMNRRKQEMENTGGFDANAFADNMNNMVGTGGTAMGGDNFGASSHACSCSRDRARHEPALYPGRMTAPLRSLGSYAQLFEQGLRPELR